MKVRVRLFGTLGRRVPGFAPGEPVEIELPAGAGVRDLLLSLGLSTPRDGIVTFGGKVLKEDAALEDGDTVEVLPPLHGG